MRVTRRRGENRESRRPVVRVKGRGETGERQAAAEK